MSSLSSAARLEACLPYIFQGEGGFTNNPKDPGNWTGGKVGLGRLVGTNFGIAASSFPNLDIKNLTQTKASEIYANRYWAPAGCDQLPAGPDLPIFDVSVNSGPSRAISFAKATVAVPDPVARVKAISAKRRAFYQGLSTFKTFGRGWMSRVATVEAAAVKIALKAQGAPRAVMVATLQSEVAVSNVKTKNGSNAGLAVGVVSGSAAGSTFPNLATDAVVNTADLIFLGGAAGIAAIGFAFAFHYVRAHNERAKAFQAELETV